MIEKYVGVSEYSMFCAENSFSFFGCAMMNQSPKIPTILLEDGIWEYSDVQMPFGFVTTMAGRLLFRFGIVNYLAKKNFYWNRFCLKYATRPEMLIEKNYY